MDKSIKKKAVINMMVVGIDPLGNMNPPLNNDKNTELSLNILK